MGILLNSFIYKIVSTRVNFLKLTIFHLFCNLGKPFGKSLKKLSKEDKYKYIE